MVKDPVGRCWEIAPKNLSTLKKMHIFRFVNLLRFLITSLDEIDVVKKRFDIVRVNIYIYNTHTYMYLYTYKYIAITISTLYFLD